MNYETIEERIKQGYYESTVSYEQLKTPLEPRISKDSEFLEKVIEEFNRAMAVYKSKKKAYNDAKNVACMRFEKDVKEMIARVISIEYQINKVYSKAYNDAHSEGLHSVLEEAEELCKLFIE